MKLSKLSWMILSVGILILGAVAIFILYQQQSDEQDELNLSLTAANSSLPGLISESAALQSQLEALEAELAEAIAALDAAEAELPRDIESSTYGDLLFDMAHDNDNGINLDVWKFEATEPVRITLDNIVYESTTIKIHCDNDLEDILRFITQIEVGLKFGTTSIDAVTIQDLEGSTGDLEDLKLVEITLLAYIGE
jgi:multidrug efflux pump subunit AcrA (membrane-fusion protein)